MLDFASLWLSDPHWQAMDPTARGFHAQLVLLAVRQGGRLPDNDAVWRRWLGLPQPGEAPGERTPAEALQALKVLEASQGRTPAGEYAQALDYYWTHTWQPMLHGAWPLGADGQRSCDLVNRLLQGTPVVAEEALVAPSPVQTAAEAPAPAAQPKPKRPRKAKAPKAAPVFLLANSNWDALVTSPMIRGEGLGVVCPLPDKLVDPDQLKARWHLPASRSTRLNLWTVGVAVLGNAEDSSKNRTFLAKMISRYGEPKVAAAVGEISGRAMPPADPRSFLLGILRRETEGSAAAQRARETRAGIPL